MATAADDPTATAFVLITISALLHAVTNVLIKSAQDRQITRAMMGVCSAIIALPFLPSTPLPDLIVWKWLALSGLIHLVYQYTLLEAYALGDFSAVYPVARGSAPMLTTLGAVFWLGDSVPPLALVGIVVIAGAMAVIGRGSGGKAGRKAMIYALITGTMIALYTLVDAQGMRAAADPMTFLVWEFLIDGLNMTAFVLVTRGTSAFSAARAGAGKGIAAGIISVVGYGIALYAYRIGPLAEVAALRETSVIYGAILGVVIFKERLGPTRIAAAIMIAAGALLVRMA